MPATILTPIASEKDDRANKPKQIKQSRQRAPRTSLLEPALRLAKSA